MKYRVHVSRDYIQHGDIEVEADSVMEAEDWVVARIEECESSLFAWGEKEQTGCFIETTEELK